MFDIELWNRHRFMQVSAGAAMLKLALRPVLAGLCVCCLISPGLQVAHAQVTKTDLQASNAHSWKVYPAQPAILYGPLLLDTAETSTTIEWVTDTPCQAKVEYGEGKLDHEAVPQEFGLIPVGTVHKITLTGLLPGHTYQYRVESTRVIHLRPYWPDKGLSVESSTYTFTTFDRSKPAISFSVITDTHENVTRIHTLMSRIDWKTTDFLVHDGDGVNYAVDQQQVWDNWLEPISAGLQYTKPMIYARGNHEYRGPFARNMSQYLTPGEGRYYFTRDDGPVHLIVLDTGEDKPDDSKVYAGLNAMRPYRDQELAWFKEQAALDPDMQQAPFRVILMHQPEWGWDNRESSKWTAVANQEKVDLVIAGHLHRFVKISPGTWGNHFPVLVVGQDQIARVDASANALKVTVTGPDGSIIDSFTIPRHAQATR